MDQAPQTTRSSTSSRHPRRTARRALHIACALLVVAPSLVAQSSSLEQATAMAEEVLRERQNPLAVALERVERARQDALEGARLPPETDDIEDSTTSDHDEAYASAVGALAKVPDPNTLPALALAASYPDAAVRYAAMSSLREGASAGRPASTALLAARSLLLGDDHAAVRRQAFEAYCRWGDQDDVLALSQALGSAPGPVRDLAVREWLRIERERLAR